MNSLDYILIFVLLIGALQGLRKGFIRQLGGLLAVVLAVFISFKFSSVTANFLEAKEWISQSFIGLASIALTFILVYYGVNVISKLIQKVVKTIGLNFINRLAGGVLGLVMHAFILGAILYFSFPFINQFKPEWIAESQYASMSYELTLALKTALFS